MILIISYGVLLVLVSYTSETFDILRLGILVKDVFNGALLVLVSYTSRTFDFLRLGIY